VGCLSFTSRTNKDTYIVNGAKGISGRISAFSYKTLTNGDIGINSDYYAYLEAIYTFKTQKR
jgi:hypothetical protein